MHNKDRIRMAVDIAGAVFKIIFVILALVAVYYLYKYLSHDTKKQAILVDKPVSAKDLKTIAATRLPSLVEGGEYTVSFWVYVQDMNHNNGIQKHVLTLGSPLNASAGFETLAVYLGATQPSLHIRTQNKDVITGAAASAADNLTTSAVSALFTNNTRFMPTETKGADIPMIDMQRWVNVTVVLSGRTTDVYMDGKLIRSTVNEGVFRVPSTGYQLELGYKDGFGGKVSRVQAYDYAVNPEEAYRIYMSGPHGPLSAIDWLRSIFAPSEMESQA
jgi:hypothetical protein